jgi:DeoR family transcriptional regulator of aga operon
MLLVGVHCPALQCWPWLKTCLQKKVTVITTCVQVDQELIKHPNIEILQPGGLLRKSSSPVTGPYAQEILTDFFCCKLFRGVDGIDLEFGPTTQPV